MKNTGKKIVAEELRRKAEELLKEKRSLTGVDYNEPDALKLIQELEVHRVELLMQNEELNLVHTEAMEAAEKYTELYDFAPTGYFTLSRKGEILELNLCGALMLGRERSKIKKSAFGFFISKASKPVFNSFIESVFNGNHKETCEITLTSNDLITSYIQLTGIVGENGDTCHITGTDITERKKGELAIHENITRLELAMQAGNLAWWEMDVETGRVVFGKRKSDMLGYRSGNFTHYQDFVDLVHADDREGAMNAMRDHLSGKSERYETEYRILTASGKYKWFLDVGSVVKKDPGGKPLTVTGIVIDLTDRKIVEEKLFESERQFRTLFTTMTEGVALHEMIYDKAGTPIDYRIINVNDAYESMIGISDEQARGKLAGELYGTGGAPYIDIYYSVVKSGKPLSFEVYFAPLKKYFFISVNSPKPNFFATIFLDITERKKIEAALQDSEKKFRNLVENALIGIYTTTLDGKHVFANEAMCKMLEYNSVDELILTGVKSIFKTPQERDKLLGMIMASKRVLNYELQVLTKKGKTINVLLNSFLSGEIITGMMMDITERKQAEEELQNKINELQRFHSVTIGRELTMIELKKEVNALLRESGEEEKYKIVG